MRRVRPRGSPRVQVATGVDGAAGQAKRVVTRFPAVVMVVRHVQFEASRRIGPRLAELNSMSELEMVFDELLLR